MCVTYLAHGCAHGERSNGAHDSTRDIAHIASPLVSCYLNPQSPAQGLTHRLLEPSSSHGHIPFLIIK